MQRVRILATLAAAALAALATGCSSLSAYPHPMTVNNGSIMGDVTFPNQVLSHTQYQITTNDFDIIGPVSGQGESLAILGLIGVGDNGYGNLWDAAKRLGADAVIDIRTDTRIRSVLRGFIFETTQTQLAGTAIRWKNKVEAPAKK